VEVWDGIVISPSMALRCCRPQAGIFSGERPPALLPVPDGFLNRERPISLGERLLRMEEEMSAHLLLADDGSAMTPD
jgi:hypothetical protein